MFFQNCLLPSNFCPQRSDKRKYWVSVVDIDGKIKAFVCRCRRLETGASQAQYIIQGLHISKFCPAFQISGVFPKWTHLPTELRLRRPCLEDSSPSFSISQASIVVSFQQNQRPSIVVVAFEKDLWAINFLGGCYVVPPCLPPLRHFS